jgi:hypothetical protein
MVKGNRYQALIGKIFSDNYKAGATAFEFGRGDLTVSAAALGIELPKNLGDVIYSVRFRSALPPGILATQPPGMDHGRRGLICVPVPSGQDQPDRSSR